jgi:hypothetical protein
MTNGMQLHRATARVRRRIGLAYSAWLSSLNAREVTIGDTTMGILLLGCLLIALGFALCLGVVLPHLLVGILAILCGILLVVGK